MSFKIFFLSLLACGGCTGSSLGLIIRSPEFPNDYGNNRDCNYTIRSSPGTSLRIEFTTFVLEQDYDTISVRNVVLPVNLFALILLEMICNSRMYTFKSSILY